VNDITSIQEVLNGYKNEIEQHYQKESPSFQALFKILKDSHRIIKTSLDQRPLEETVQPITEDPEDIASNTSSVSTASNSASIKIKTRAEAYKLLAVIGEFLAKVEPHSPTPQLVRQLATWENKSLSDILQDITQSPQEFTMLLKLLGSGSS